MYSQPLSIVFFYFCRLKTRAGFRTVQGLQAVPLHWGLHHFNKKDILAVSRETIVVYYFERRCVLATVRITNQSAMLILVPHL